MKTPELTPGEGGMLAIAALLVTSGVTSGNSDLVKMTALVAGAVVAIAAGFVTRSIRRERNVTERNRIAAGK